MIWKRKSINENADIAKDVQFPFDKVTRRWYLSAKWVLFKARKYGLINIRDSSRVCVQCQGCSRRLWGKGGKGGVMGQFSGQKAQCHLKIVA